MLKDISISERWICDLSSCHCSLPCLGRSQTVGFKRGFEKLSASLPITDSIVSMEEEGLVVDERIIKTPGDTSQAEGRLTKRNRQL